MATLTGQTIASSYDGLLKLADNDGLTASVKNIQDGFGVSSVANLSTAVLFIKPTSDTSSTPTSGKEFEVVGNALITGDLQVDNLNINDIDDIISIPKYRTLKDALYIRLKRILIVRINKATP